MGLLVFVRNLLLALCLFLVLGFLYYSAWKLHLLQWEEDSNSVVLSFDSAGQTLGSGTVTADWNLWWFITMKKGSGSLTTEMPVAC
ncbi:ST3 beta-galactoside alpha-2,3-sialyltransferase 3 [Homo sapiens]|uniref:ST3 beta-galactoside alpha-2,3-sialyltransferase 3 n=2 Tax=Hominidae TaxID=9604 RepID=E9PJI3_HUMAN|nr:ST3 beta-galactoside alpha-2,3-sialyltransferase 3 [Homo sapiens]PNJ21903.1 ST3GAL3 isoform 37 [Pongo abelii]KAI2516708.1 ST3 beta-galactoside alpha-2,3-sialyltransferase 3 [Homo sapiens]KAI2516709.1 ST3 beta-galactoside alpha-2,3-sialyltransferase 3 [Homo sapiens]KAI4080207.1 ST3 beta-galactoside alpha-2,3-sialyltransferase 3 [Homo sapiens]